MNQQKSPLSRYDLSDYCTTHEAAKILGTSLRTIQLWVESGILQAWKTPGGHRRVTRESIQQLFERRTSRLLSDTSSVPTYADNEERMHPSTARADWVTSFGKPKILMCGR